MVNSVVNPVLNPMPDGRQSKSVRQLLDEAKKAIAAQHDLTFSEPSLEARILLEHVINKSHAWMIAHADTVIESASCVEFKQKLDERLSGKPIAYITGSQGFWSLDLLVNESTLIPRQDTECLVETALSFEFEQANALDLGTGTGAIAIALGRERPKWRILALDRIVQAVELAKKNVLRNLVEPYNVQVQQSNWFSALEGGQARFDLIVSNPPYVEPDSEYLSQGDLRFEPSTALCAQDNGLSDIKVIIKTAPNFLKPNGVLMLEHGARQAPQIGILLQAAGFVQITHKKDYNNLDRVTWARLPSSKLQQQ